MIKKRPNRKKRKAAKMETRAALRQFIIDLSKLGPSDIIQVSFFGREDVKNIVNMIWDRHRIKIKDMGRIVPVKGLLKDRTL